MTWAGILYLAAMAWIIVRMFPDLLRIFCVFGWHSWEFIPGGHRECPHCKKRQTYIKVGDRGNWQ
ncbi:hypothetical protein VPHD479_0320 [Vibrio phage D479]